MGPQFIEQLFIGQQLCIRCCSRYWGYSSENNTAFSEHVCAPVWQGQESGGEQPGECSGYPLLHNCHPQTQRLKSIAALSLAQESAVWAGILEAGSSWLQDLHLLGQFMSWLQQAQCTMNTRSLLLEGQKKGLLKILKYRT